MYPRHLINNKIGKSFYFSIAISENKIYLHDQEKLFYYAVKPWIEFVSGFSISTFGRKYRIWSYNPI